MKHITGLLPVIALAVLLFPGPARALPVSDSFDDGVVDPALWEEWNPLASAKSALVEQDGRLNFVFTGLEMFEEGFIAARYRGLLPAGPGDAFTLGFDLNHGIVGSGLPNLGILLEPAVGGGVIFFDLLSGGTLRVFADDSDGAVIEEALGVLADKSAAFSVRWSGETGLLEFTVRQGASVVAEETLGLMGGPGSLGTVLWTGLDAGLRASLVSDSLGVNTVPGDLSIDNFTLTTVPEPGLAGLGTGLAVLAAVVRRSRRYEAFAWIRRVRR